MIRVFDSTDKTYETNGNVVLQPTYSNIHKEDNGEYYLDIETNLQNEVIKHIESEEGTNVDLTYSTKLTDVDATKQHEFTKMYGETQQDSTTGKNKYNATKSSNTTYNITNSATTSTISINGTANASNRIVWGSTTLKAGTYTFSMERVNANRKIEFYIYKTGTWENPMSGHVEISNTQDRDSKSFTLSEDMSIMVGIWVNNGEQYSNCKVKYQIVSGSSADYNFEPYTNGASPNPDYPQPIHNVSGDNTIEICGKNLFGRLTKGYIGNNGEIISGNTNDKITPYIPTQANKTYWLTGLSGSYSRCAVYDQNKNFISEVLANSSGNTRSFITPNNACYLLVSVSDYNDTKQIQLEKNNQATTYEAYTGNSQLISLGVENLFNSTLESGVVTTVGIVPTNTRIASNQFIKLKANTQYTISYETNSNINQINISYFSTNDFPRASETWWQSVSTKDNRNYLTFTTSSNEYVLFSFRNSSDTTIATTNISNIQIEKGSKANSYSPYGASYIELNKISTYQDYIYKDNDRWFLHKEIGKVVLNGSEEWDIATATGFQAFVLNGAVNTGSLIGFSNYYKNFASSKWTYMGNNNFIVGRNNNQIIIRNDNISTTSDLETWLSTHNTLVYYVLATPTDTEITDTTLLEQLENLNKMTLYEGINNIPILPNDLVPTLKLHYNYVEGGDLTTGDYLKPNNIIVSNTPTGNQAFRITNIDKRTHKIKIKANHVFFDSLNYVIQDSYVVDKNCNDALDHLNNATDNTSPFTTTSDINTINSYRCVRKSLYEAINVVLERWGGHLVRDNFDIKVMNTIGQDNGVVVRYAKNLKDIEVDYNWDEVCTKILPVGEDGLMLDEIYLYGDIQYDIPYSKVIHFAQDVDTTPYEDEDGNIDEDAYTQALKNDLRSQANNYLQEHQLPQVNYTLQANLEKITDVGDIIQVIDERLGVNITTSLISFDYDPILERYTYLEFGNFKKQLSNLTEIMATQTNEIVSEATATTRITLENELNEATSKIWGVLGSSYVLVEGDKILILDSLPKETATNVIMLNSAGIGFSNTGINGTFTSAWTIDNVLNMQNINVINLTADLIKGGTLKLGSNLNQNGILEVYDESNNLIAELNKDGLKMFATDGGYILINTTVGFAGYDRNNVKIYWADGDEFHMKKSVVEEEITLVDKMRIIPITITDEYDQIINDGIGFVSTL